MIELHYYNWVTQREEVIQLPKDHITSKAQINEHINIASYMKDPVDKEYNFVRRIIDIEYTGDIKKIKISNQT
mgnify:FL=1